MFSCLQSSPPNFHYSHHPSQLGARKQLQEPLTLLAWPPWAKREYLRPQMLLILTTNSNSRCISIFMKITTSTSRALQLRSSLVSSPWKSTEIWRQLFSSGMRKQYVKCLLAYAHPTAKEGLLPLEPSFWQLSPNTEFTRKIFIKFIYNPHDAHVAEHPTT